jgi:beta-galactosidase
MLLRSSSAAAAAPPPPPLRPLLLLLLLLVLAPSASADFTTVIAQQQASAPGSPTAASWFDGLATWVVTDDAVPPSPAAPSGAPARTMVFGNPLEFAVGPVNPASSFQVALTFLDDGGDRVQTLNVGSSSVSPPGGFALPPKTITTVRWAINASACTPRGDGRFQLAFSFARLQGPNAILSSFVLYSSNASDAPVAPVAPAVPSHALPRLTPRPLAVAGAAAVSVDLLGTWQFDAAPPAGLLRALRAGDARAARAALAARAESFVDIIVPGEYTLQGHRIAPGAPVLYATAFATPADWAALGLRAKLRFDGAYSNATVYVNGALAGAHLGGFTPFELDVTALLEAPGGVENNLTVVLVAASLADSLASATQYAAHDIGGIARKVYLMAVPAVSIADVHIVTAFAGGDYSQAQLLLNISVANDGAADTDAPAVVSAALSFAGGSVEASGQVSFASVAGAGGVAYLGLNLSVSAPPLWDPEHPNLHNLTLTLTYASAPAETVQLRVGFRDVRVVGNRIVVNGRAIKAHGTTRHETHPLAGRSLWSVAPEGKQWERDIIAFRDANINFIRTSHYPPAEELMEAADELGMFIELEMPFCWASANSGGAALNYTVQAQREAMVFNRNHPSVIHWSLGNESPWNGNFAESLATFLREVDSTRPFMFDGGDGQTVPPLDLVSVHYPSFSNVPDYANGAWPTLFGEYAHLNCYNRREIATDPGVRDIWGLGIEHMWELVWAADGVLGACYWAGIDDIFYMPSGEPVGYGEWGVIDAWRRPKPETFLVRNIYAPVVMQVPAPGSAWAPRLNVSNRFDFTDLSEVAFTWSILESGIGGAGAASGAPHATGLTLELQGLPSPLSGTLQINATSPRGFLVNSWTFALQPAPAAQFPPPPPLRAAATAARGAAAAPSVQELPDGRLLIQDSAGGFSWFVTSSGSVAGNTSGGGALLSSGPTLMVLAINDDGGMQLTEGMPPILPFNAPLTAWAASNRTFATVGDAVVVTVTGSYAEAAGSFALRFDAAARLTANYSFTWLAQAASVSPRQVGLVFGVPAGLARLSWRRSTPWATSYPADHIGRAAGDGVPANAGPAPGNTTRSCAWANDPSPLGDADFRSTRHNITVFELGDGSGSARALAFLSDGASQHGRAWFDADANGGAGGVGLLAADLSNEGGNPFSREAVLPHRTIAAGSVLEGSALLQLGSALGGVGR